MAGFLSIGGQLTGTPLGALNLAITITPNSAGNLAVTTLTPVSGANTISVPSWAVGAIIEPSTTNAVGWTIKGVSGDSGLGQNLTQPALLGFPASPPSTIVITAASAFATVMSVTFF